MDSERFDTLTRLLGQGITRRGVTTTLAALAAAGLLAPDVATAKKRRRKKKKKKQSSPAPVPVCDDLRKTCADECCGGLVCDTSKEECDLSGNRCLRDVNDPCEDDCDCRGFFSCSERVGNTCQACSGLREGCPDGDNDCCLSQSFCGNNGCNNDNDGNVCVFLNLGTACTESCQCAAELGCDERSGFECGFCVREASAMLSPSVQEECSENDDCCRGDYVCGASPGCQGAPMTVCCGPPQASCLGDCDCCGAFSNCARAIAFEENACGDSNVCCQTTNGACFDDCDCCAELECDGVTCQPKD